VRFLYSLFLYLLIPPTIQRLVWRGLRQRGYWRRWGERFGWAPRLAGPPTATDGGSAENAGAVFPATARDGGSAENAGAVFPLIWVHAVSVGEVRAAGPLVRALQRDYPAHRVLVTTMTPTGSDTVRLLFGDTVAHCYVPYDLPTAVARFLRRTRPQLALIMETELWPNLFHACRARGIPLVVANARLSEQSARGYRRFARLTRATLAEVSVIGAQSANDAARLRALGAASVEVTGSIKFELSLPDDLADRARVLRNGFGARPVWVAASTRDGEELYVLEAFAMLRASYPELLLILVPRHPERFEEVARLCAQRGFRIERRSARQAVVAADTAILLGDTMGELLLFYAAADVACIGGSFLPLGGQNPLESLAVGTPVVFGPHMFNFSEISAMALEHGAAQQVQDSRGLARAVDRFLANAEERQRAGAAGRRMVEQNRGALDRTLALVRRVFRG
jgi:3-deoxy-D-manno-octulosonic-acid transferase